MGEAPPQLQQLWPPRQAREAALPPPGRRKPMLYLHEASKAYSASDSLIHPNISSILTEKSESRKVH